MPTAQPKPSCTYQPVISSVAKSSISSGEFDGLGWLSRFSYGEYPTSEPHHFTSANQRPERFDVQTSPRFVQQSILPSESHQTSMSWSAWNGDVGLTPDGSSPYPSPSRIPVSSSTYYPGQLDLSLSAWVTPHYSQQLSQSCLSVPCTPIRPRQTQRFSSLPSLLDNQTRMDPSPADQAHRSQENLIEGSTTAHSELIYPGNNSAGIISAW